MSRTLVYTRTPNFCTVALACKARTTLHYPLSHTVDDVGIADCTTTCSLTDPHSRLRRCVNHATSAHRLAASPDRVECMETGLAWIDRTPEGRRDAMGDIPFPPLPTVSSARPLIKCWSGTSTRNLVESVGFEPTHPLKKAAIYQLIQLPFNCPACRESNLRQYLTFT